MKDTENRVRGILEKKEYCDPRGDGYRQDVRAGSDLWYIYKTKALTILVDDLLAENNKEWEEGKRLHKCYICGKPIPADNEWIRSGPLGAITRYYHEQCVNSPSRFAG